MENKKRIRSILSLLSRNKILAQMNAMQSKFAAENAEDLEGVDVEMSGPDPSGGFEPMDTTGGSNRAPSAAVKPVAVGRERTASNTPDTR